MPRVVWIRKAVFLDEREHFAAPCGFDGAGNSTALALNDPEHWYLVPISREFSPVTALADATVKHLVDLNRLVAVERCFVVQHRANLFEHSPGGFVCDAQFALQVLRADPATAGGHQVDRVEPQA